MYLCVNSKEQLLTVHFPSLVFTVTDAVCPLSFSNDKAYYDIFPILMQPSKITSDINSDR